jgi:alpha-ribazole phosphatase
MKVYRIYMFRHGLTQANEDGTYVGVTDEPLSERGISLLREKRERTAYPSAERVYSSPLLRALQTASVLYPEHEPVAADGLREMNFGVFEGLKADELVGLDSYKRWLRGGMDNAPPNGESLREVTLRSYAALDALILDMMKNGILNAAVITHSGILMNTLSCFGIPKRKPMEYACGAGEGRQIMATAALWHRDGVFEIGEAIPLQGKG